MKLLFVIFAVFSYAVLVQNQSLPDHIHELTNIYTKNIKKDFMKVYYNIESAVNQTVTKIETLNTTHVKAVQKDIDYVNSQIQSNINKGYHFKICALKQLPHFKNVTIITRNTSELCGYTHLKSIQNYEEVITKDISEVENHLIDNRLGVIGCIHLSPIETTNCVFEKIGNYSIVIQDMSKAQEYTIQNNSNRTIASATLCYNNVLDSLITENENILKNMNLCISFKP